MGRMKDFAMVAEETAIDNGYDLYMCTEEERRQAEEDELTKAEMEYEQRREEEYVNDMQNQSLGENNEDQNK